MQKQDKNYTDWQPNIDYASAKRRHQKISTIRNYFNEHGVLEVDSPILSTSAVSDINIESINTSLAIDLSRNFYLQTSPEFYMKRMLADGFKDIYQICKVFRDDELGRLHSPEFTMIEWYRLDFNLNNMIDETLAVINLILHDQQSDITVKKISYCKAFEDYLGIDPLRTNIETIIKLGKIDSSLQNQMNDDINQYLDFLYATQVTKNFDPEILTVIHHYPASQAALARISPNDDQVSDRFEVFYGNIELANGYVELTDIHQTRQRFQNDQQLRQKQGKVTRPLDEYFIAAIASGLPDCAGVALGFDRLFMISEGKSDIQSVQPFTIK
jgi:lysyl-tRNA synthetase class 2|tara:strand:+ start:1920 stop:2903 length:984 start_codon:yes stop_codon:yes gene_type:complete